MTYFYIRNKGSLNRRLVEIVGLTTKRSRTGDHTVIGHKGSGKKLAAIAALRAGLRTCITSVDKDGSYFLRFMTKSVDVEGLAAQQVVFHYDVLDAKAEHGQRRVRQDTNWCTDAFADWDQPVGDDDKRLFKLLREHVIDAYDADVQFEWGTSDTYYYAVEGDTTVYLDYRPEFETVFEQSERYFKFLCHDRPLVTIVGRGDIWEKSQKETTRLFLLGVLVDCSKDVHRSSLFDYSLNDKSLLNEDRTLKSTSWYEAKLGAMLARLTDQRLCAIIIAGIADGIGATEQNALGYATEMTPKALQAWRDAVHGVFGPKLALPSLNDVVNSDVQQIYKHTIVQTGNLRFRDFLRRIGIPDADEVFPKPEKRVDYVHFDDLDGESQDRFIQAFRIFGALYPEGAHVPIRFFFPLDEAMKRMAAYAGYGPTQFKEICIQAASRTSLPPVEVLLHALFHEWRHCRTKKFDKDREFVSAADHEILDHIAHLIELVNGDIAKLHDGPELKPNFAVEEPTIEVTFDDDSAIDALYRQLEQMEAEKKK